MLHLGDNPIARKGAREGETYHAKSSPSVINKGSHPMTSSLSTAFVLSEVGRLLDGAENWLRELPEPALMAGFVPLLLFAGWILAVGVLAALYSSWTITLLAGNLLGLPSWDNAVFYWTYFFAKRIPLFFF